MSPMLDLPCIAFHDYDHRSTVLFSISEHKHIVHGDADEVLRNKIICPTAQGLLLVRDPDTMATFLWNPLRSDDDKPLRLLSDAPAASSCVVILVEGCNDTFIWYCRPGAGDDHWEKYEYDIGSHVLRYPDGEEDQIQKDVICSIAAHGGKFYFDNAALTELCVIDFGTGASSPEPTLTTVAVDDTVTADGGDYGHGRHRPCRVFLVESGGDLYMVRLLFRLPDRGGDEIDRCCVNRMDFSTLKWCNVRDLGGRAFLLSRFYFGASCSAGGDHGGLLPDRVYFVLDRNKTLQVFDVQDGSYQLQKLDGDPKVVDKAFWLLPINP
ncbi:hypothetical protein SORBI_3003G391700 [Sorghum bicolor]|uniref:KIB1-4 beta-propeller domain-containing protein n=1 Tax=Sorghum bicolor TaxID=4558 RepID=A0A1W0W118_SORBI|nr:hypothetical protein SORBI_3003G391700 [Sorghum bicolor]